MRIVKFKNGKYAIRRWMFGWQYKDLRTPGNMSPWWWGRHENWFCDCVTDDLELVKRIFYERTDRGTPIGRDGR